MVWWRAGIVLGGLVACGGPSEPGDDTDVPVDDSEDTVPVEDSEPPIDTDTAPPVETDVEPPPASTAPFTVSAPVVCLSPSLRVEARYDQRTAAVAVPEDPYIAGGGVALVDVDGDDVPEIVSVRQDEVALLRRDGETALTSTPLLFRDHVGKDGFFGVAAGDYDGDLDFDLYITALPGPNVLLQNDGAGQFTDVTAAAGVAGPLDHYSASSTWGDVDGDGDLDLVVAGHGWVDEDGDGPVEALGDANPSLLFLNQGDGTFVDATERIDPAAQGQWAFSVALDDFDGDGDLDAYFGNDFAGRLDPSRALRNDGGWFSMDPAFATLEIHLVGMGLGVNDINSDGVPDVLLPGFGELGLLISHGGYWFDDAASSGVYPNEARGQEVAWGSEIEDFDNDGDLDALVTYGYLNTRFNPNPIGQPDALYAQSAGMVFRDLGREWGLAQADPTRSVSVGDLNGDGYLDIVKAGTGDRLRTFESRCGDRTWLRVRLRQPGLNRHAIGAKVRAIIADQDQHRTVRAGGTGYASSNPPEVFFGMNGFERVEEVEVRWPDGRVDHVYDVPTRTTLTIERP